MSLLRKTVPRDALNGLWQRARSGSFPKKRPCPGCSHRMEEVTIDAGGQLRQIDVCTACQFVWLDQGEWDDLPFFAVEKPSPEAMQAQVRARIEKTRLARNAPPPLPPLKAPAQVKASLGESKTVSVRAVERAPSVPVVRRRDRSVSPPTIRQRSASRPPVASGRSPVAEVLRCREQLRRERSVPKPQRSSGWGTGPAQTWQWIPALFGMPVEDEQPTGRRRVDEKPWLTWTLALGVGLVSVLAMLDLRPMIDAYGLIPAESGRLGGLTWLTSFFLHGGVLHLLGNLYFLVIFGDNVEKCLGALELFLLIVVAAIFGDIVHILLDPDSTVPCIGASGGISGVIAFYALRFPKTRLAVMFWLLFKTYWFRMSAIWMFGLWVLMQIFIAGQQVAGISQVSGGAHLGGALVGVVAWLLWRVNGGARDERTYRSL